MLPHSSGASVSLRMMGRSLRTIAVASSSVRQTPVATKCAQTMEAERSFPALQ